MLTYTYRDLLKRAEQLDPDEQLLLLEGLAAMIRRKHEAAPASSKRSILELEGLGAEIWKGIDIDEYINQERNSWDG